MKQKKNKTEYFRGRIKKLVEMVARSIVKDPGLVNDLPYFHTMLGRTLEGYGQRDKCFNCKRSMKITIYTADILDALLILAMATKVREHTDKGTPFTSANRVHLPTLKVTQGILKRSTKCDYLGLIKQPENWRGSGYWLLTHWAWKALRGDEVPKSVKYWEGHLIGRSEELTTLAGMFRTHGDIVANAIAKKRAVRADYRSDFSNYEPKDWSSFGGYIQDEKNEHLD